MEHVASTEQGNTTVGLVSGAHQRTSPNLRMRRLLMVSALAIASGCSSTAEEPQATAPVETVVTTPTTVSATWIDRRLEQLRSGEDDDPPERILRFDEPDGAVFLVTYGCCDRFSELYDERGTLLGHPDGGFTGAGDGTTSFEPTTAGVVLWPEG